MTTRRNLNRNLRRIQKILQKPVPGLTAWIDPLPGPGGALDILIRHPNGRIIRSHHYIADKLSLLPETVAGKLLDGMRKLGWPCTG